MVPCIIQHFNKINFLDKNEEFGKNIQIKFKFVSSGEWTGTKLVFKKIRSPIIFCQILKNKRHHSKILLSSLHLNVTPKTFI